MLGPKRGSLLLKLLTLLLMSMNPAEGRFRSSRQEVWYDSKEQCSGPCWANYTETSSTDYSIEIAWVPLQNSGFDYFTEIEMCTRNDDELRSTKQSLYPSSNIMNHTHFYVSMVEDRYWRDCTITTLGMVRLHRFFDLLSGRPYRFRVRQLHIDYPSKNITTPWSWPKILATTVPKEWRQHEYA